MAPANLTFGFVLLFFFYGLAFFSMGIALSLEISRSSMLAERRVLLPLALFGLLHGAHEWTEIVLLEGVWTYQIQLSELRVVLLAVSFIVLVVFGVSMLCSQTKSYVLPIFLGAGWLILYCTLVYQGFHIDPEYWLVRADVLARYLWAIPGGILAGLAFRVRARQVQAENRMNLARYFRWAALGFFVYGITQAFVSPTDMFPANQVNTRVFLNVFGFPIQVIRAAMALWITINLLRAIQYVDRELQQQLSTAQQARLDALEQVQRELVARETLRRELLRHTVTSQEDERARIARELHDETAQTLTAFTLNLATIQSTLTKRSKITGLIDRLQGLSQQMSRSLYRIVHDLRPSQLDDLGLVPALEYLVDESRERLGIVVRLEVNGQRQRLDYLIETVFFRVAQEALTNISRHAQIKQASISLSFNPQKVTLQVRDSGVGFSVNEDLIPPRGWGLASMRERAESIGGHFHILSYPGSGTTVEVIVPLTEPTNKKVTEEVSYENHPLDARR
jgi:signal transduction histidine kinase